MSRILHKIEEKFHIHHKHGDDPAQDKPEEIHENDESKAQKKGEHDKKNLMKKVAGKIGQKLLHGHPKKQHEEGYEGEEEEEGEEVEVEEAEEGGFEFELNFDF